MASNKGKVKPTEPNFFGSEEKADTEIRVSLRLWSEIQCFLEEFDGCWWSEFCSHPII